MTTFAKAWYRVCKPVQASPGCYSSVIIIPTSSLQ